jgi:hypothetical protein
MKEIRRAVRPQGAVQLIDHEDQDVWLLGHIWVPEVLFDTSGFPKAGYAENDSA